MEDNLENSKCMSDKKVKTEMVENDSTTKSNEIVIKMEAN